MTLQNLLRIGRLKPHSPAPQEIQRLLAAAERHLTDARVAAVSDETRFDAAYKAIMQSALIAMMARGFRPATNEPGHHQTLIQSLPLTLGVSNDVWVVIDALRRERNGPTVRAIQSSRTP
ncbi:MAG: DNA-binding protein [Gammaproteobacteria bacterium]